MDADAALVAQARQGDASAFEGLVQRHQRRVYRVLLGITGNTAEAEDATQNAFLKAYLNLKGFKEEARFSTWLTRIAINEGLQRLRSREKNVDSLDDPGPEGDEEFRPRQVQAWDDNPEQRYTKTEVREILEREIMKLPAKYRVVVVMRVSARMSSGPVPAAHTNFVPPASIPPTKGSIAVFRSLCWAR